ncbi:hypothetical protein WMR74_002802 [Providencia rettgeri]
MKKNPIISVPSHIYHPAQPQKDHDFITENIRSVGNKNPLKNFIKKLFKRKKTAIITDTKKMHNNALSQEKNPVVPLSIKLNSQNHIKPNLHTTENIDLFIKLLSRENIYFENKESVLDPHKKNRLILSDYVGSGTYGTVYRVGNFAIKIPNNKEHQNTHFANLGRSRRILTEVNQDKNFARVTTLKNGTQVLVSKFIDGKSVTGNKAYQFVKSKGRILHDYNVNGNVRKDKQEKMYLIDADFASLPIEKRRNSLGSNQLYTLFPSYTSRYLKIQTIPKN